MRSVLCALSLLALTSFLAAADADVYIQKARAALRDGDAAAALDAAKKAVEADPKNPVAVFLRGEAYAAQRKPADAIKDYDAAWALDKTYLIAIDRRGGERFKLGQVAESIDDFNTYLKAFPSEEPKHWRRGISFYYAAKYAEGAKQFYDGRMVFGADVENAFWHYLCNARKDGVEKAKAALLALDGPDKRVPMMRVYDLLQGKAKPEDVVRTAEEAKLSGEQKTEALFYAHLYVGLYHEAHGDAAGAREHLTTAAEKHKIGHYMWDVANVHVGRLKTK